jgi:hypothetical protein
MHGMVALILKLLCLVSTRDLGWVGVVPSEPHKEKEFDNETEFVRRGHTHAVLLQTTLIRDKKNL